jgi:hypothetical protein
MRRQRSLIEVGLVVRTSHEFHGHRLCFMPPFTLLVQEPYEQLNVVSAEGAEGSLLRNIEILT